jgi:benzoate-CoA ligase family protein
MKLDIPSRLNIACWCVDRPAREHPEAIAILGEPSPVRYDELSALTNRAGNALKMLGCEPQDRVLIVLPDSLEFIAAFFGAVKIGAVAVPVDPLAKTADYAHYLADSGPRVAVVHAAALPQFTPALEEAPACEVIVVGGKGDVPGMQNWDRLIHTSTPALEGYPTTAEDPAFFLYTSGSTGLPKAAIHRHKGMLVTTRSFAEGVLAMGPADRILSIPKFFFAFGLGNGMYYPLSVGAATILNPDRPRLDKVAELIARYRPTILFSVPTFLRALFKELDNGLALDFSSIRLVVYGGEPAPTELFNRFQKQLGVEMLEGFGSTEMLQTFLSNRPGQVKIGTCGFEVPNYALRLLRDDGQHVSVGEVGSLSVRGESAFAGYWNRPELTAHTKVDDWVITGDRFYRDVDGYYHFCGRQDNMLKISGKWVSPGEVELALCQHPSIEQAAVVGKGGDSDPKQLVAYLVVKDCHDVSSGELRRYLAESLPDYMIPGRFLLVGEFPLTGSGKIDRQALTEDVSMDRVTELDPRHALSFVAPRTPTEKKLAEIWSEVLNVPTVGVFEDFIELGGDSILAMQCLSRMRQVFNVDVSVNVFFGKAANLSLLAEIIDKAYASA